MKRINELRKMLIVRVTQSGMTTETNPKKKMVPLALESTLCYKDIRDHKCTTPRKQEWYL